MLIEFSGLFAANEMKIDLTKTRTPMKIDLNLHWISLQALQSINHGQLRKETSPVTYVICTSLYAFLY